MKIILTIFIKNHKTTCNCTYKFHQDNFNEHKIQKDTYKYANQIIGISKYNIDKSDIKTLIYYESENEKHIVSLVETTYNSSKYVLFKFHHTSERNIYYTRQKCEFKESDTAYEELEKIKNIFNSIAKSKKYIISGKILINRGNTDDYVCESNVIYENQMNMNIHFLNDNDNSYIIPIITKVFNMNDQNYKNIITIIRNGYIPEEQYYVNGINNISDIDDLIKNFMDEYLPEEQYYKKQHHINIRNDCLEIKIMCRDSALKIKKIFSNFIDLSKCNVSMTSKRISGESKYEPFVFDEKLFKLKDENKKIIIQKIFMIHYV